MSNYIFVKYCPLCGAENTRQQAFCSKCADGDLSTVPAEPRRVAPASSPASHAQAVSGPACILELLEDPAFQFRVPEGRTVGRTQAADVVLAGVPKLDWISSIHARFSRRGEQWYIQHIGTTNFIKVDGEMYKGQEDVAIYDGSIVVLSLTAFRVKIGGG